MNAKTSLHRAVLQGAALRQINLETVPIAAAQVNSTFGDASVILPAGMDRPAHWPDWELPGYGAHGFGTEWRKWRDDPEGYVPPIAPGD